ncbi:nickel pincer cofactor biosynthesis protein LarC [Actinomycetospora succinea]|uniref:nickel pincer cofactor biosynthesis protein LarC n=1 Tax=Actinomycetospora succinea TaxID=663603 RepID=UPI001FB6894D|nr:nickel pincer cofactor biosynthesis protein LarC [Actinomycetospora succinea]
MSRTLWIDPSAGVAGDMLLAALLDLGASLEAVRAAVDAVIPGEVAIAVDEVSRAGLRARHVEVTGTAADPTHRAWPEVRTLLRSEPPAALMVFERLAVAEAAVHGVAVEDVHFHEVGAWDAIADVVGVCAALEDLGVTAVTSGPVALGSGHVETAHGRLPVPAPAVLELARGRDVLPGGPGERATPTGMALLAALADPGPMPAMRVEATGVGAGTRDTPGQANVVRAVLGTTGSSPTETLWLLETNVDDLDPRVWSGVLEALLAAGAADAWLTPIVMKKGRPAHTLSVLAPEQARDTLRAAVFDLTPTLGVRESPVARTALERAWRTVPVDGGSVRIKVGLRGGRVVSATPEFDDADALARARAVPVRRVLDEATAAARAAGLYPTAPWIPDDQDVPAQGGPSS